MWIVKWFFWVIVLFMLILFITQNVDFLKQAHKLQFLFWETKEAIPIWVVMFISFAVGVLIWMVGSIFKVIELKATVKKVSKENIALKKELNELRNIPIDEEAEAMEQIEKKIG
ncbi:MAG: lipopolysaccharide assembly protein LapA domain-containing protein [candidate division KSB1 bacterium]|nr:lipopolysaccharide assembly protein LapA domain-containing protein [candidate division KSB1 bacterium]MDZ7335203.1 lipopolysaccharide assembly protein LapA domain-containing protein [candidate division KSB1 bacterium]MDZ7356510.1 lipopolysaccharide assembly protein LapA domain-containing protein [candidate division KSB1 bacterium]MDZ7400745.1 lipopolysaccharide assembly protein LapA domain-containing protein [candidate division KSB1 bacterium]